MEYLPTADLVSTENNVSYLSSYYENESVAIVTIKKFIKFVP